MEHKKHTDRSDRTGRARSPNLEKQKVKERDITKAAEQELDKMGCLHWTAHKRAFMKEQDIFGCFDIIALYKDEHLPRPIAIFIQCTTKRHLADRRRKIVAYFGSKKLPIPSGCFIWAYDSKTSSFKKELLK